MHEWSFEAFCIVVVFPVLIILGASETQPIKHLRGYVNFWEIFLSLFISRITRLCICSILG